MSEVTLEAIYKALRCMREHGFYSCDIFIKQDALNGLMRRETLAQIEREQQAYQVYGSIVDAEFNRILLAGSPVAAIYGCSVYDMPTHTDNNADAVVCAHQQGYYVVVGKEDELGIFRGWLVS
jgi:hypothetical protein